MTERDTLRQLIEDGTIVATLRRGTSSRHATRALQTLLHWLGFDGELEWAKYGADGDYGKATVAAVAAFAERNGSRAKGSRVSASLAERILARYDSLEALKQLAEDLEKNRVERYYRKGGGDRVRIATAQTLLHDLGFDAELGWQTFGADGHYGRSTTAAVAAFGQREGVGGDGSALTAALAARMVARLGALYGASWNAPLHKATPAPASLSITSVLGRNNRQYVRVSDGVRQTRFARFRRGLFTRGSQGPAAFVDEHAARLEALGVTRSELNVMIAVAENEGNLDAINTWDNAFLSFGMFQWTAGTGSAKGELPALLARIKAEDRDLFDRYCGQHGLDVVDVTPGPVYGYFALRGSTMKTPALKQQLRAAPWAFHFWLAGQDPAVQAMEIKHALGRLDQFYDSASYTVGPHRVSDLVTSEYGVGLLLDNHVNRPAYVKDCLAGALAGTGLDHPGDWGSEEERTLIDAYLEIRVTHGRSPMTDAEKRARVTKKYLRDGTISDQRGSFRRSSSP